MDCGGLCALTPLLFIAPETTESGGNANHRSPNTMTPLLFC